MKRRSLFLLAGGVGATGLLIGFGLRAPTPASRLGDGQLLAPKEGEAALNGWVKIDRDGLVHIAMPRAEMGQGSHTGLAQLLAEELDADWSTVRVLDAPVAGIYANQALLLNVLPLRGEDDDGSVARFARGAAQRLGYLLALQVTGGSSSVRDAWGPMRHAGAVARQLLLKAAADAWKLPVAELRTEAGQVLHASGRKAGYGELAAAAAKLTPPQEVSLKPRAQWRFIGHSTPRLDLPPKVDGTAGYGVDVRLPGMLYAALRQSPSFGGRLVGLDTAALQQRPGVRAAFAIGPRTAVVVADSWWRAEAALKAHAPEWLAGPKGSLNTKELRDRLARALDQREGSGFRNDGDARAELLSAARKLQARYEAPMLAHAPLEPQNCTAQVKDGKVTVWVPTQVASLARWKAAQVADVALDAVTVHTTYLGGGFGRRLETDVVEQAVAIALRTEGLPVKLLWNREEDFTQSQYRPMAMAHFEAALASDGKPLAWLNKLAGPSLAFDTTDRLLPGMAADMPDKNHIEGAYELPYAIPNLRVRQLRVPIGVPVASWRSVGHSLNGFFTEGFIDELALAAGQDPFQYRDALLDKSPRHRAVLRLAAQKAGWGQALPPGRARGIALHESFGSICAQVAEVSVQGQALKVHRVTVALDAGTLVNPDAVRAQMEGSVIFALSAALYGEITVEGGAIQQRNFPQQPLLSLADTPQIDCHFIGGERDPGGVGEPGVPPLAPAVVNAIAAATGRRLRRLPIRL